jgi:hypothetical protein
MAISEQIFNTPGTYSWTAPAGVTSVSAVAVGAGGGGSVGDYMGQDFSSQGFSKAGGGGGLGWKNNIPVVPGQTYTVVVGQGGGYAGNGTNSYFINLTTVVGFAGLANGTGGAYIGDGGGYGGLGRGGGGGAGGYTGNGGNGETNWNYPTSSNDATDGAGGGGGGGTCSAGLDPAVNAQAGGGGGGVGLDGQGTNGSKGQAAGQAHQPYTGSVQAYRGGHGGSGGTDAVGTSNLGTTKSGDAGQYGGGGGGWGTPYSSNTLGGKGGNGAVRIIWGAGAAFPNNASLVEILPTSFPIGIKNNSYSQTITASGGTGPYTFSVVSGTLPTGLSLTTGGVLTGTPTTSGTYTFTVKALDSNNRQATRSYSTTIATPGRGALVDGAVVDPTSKEASMLFHSVTFITPNADALTMTNGVRVEWLNSFTYFANIGLHATRGTGRYDANTSTTRYGAEVRSIGSANVYGNYGAYAEGADTLMYLINHNFAYIGAGTDSNNDPSLNNHPNEVFQLGGGKIYYQSLDNKGNFQVGEAFKVNYETGNVTFNGVSVNAGGVTAISFATAGSETIINATDVDTGNIKFSGNTISSLYGNVNLLSDTDEFNIPHDAAMTKDLNVVKDFSVEGTLTIGNQVVDRVQFSADVVYDLRPTTNNTYNLGSSTNKWLGVYVRELDIGTSLKVSGNTVQTLVAGTNLSLEPNGSGIVVVPSNNVLISNDLQVNDTTNLNTTSITGTVELKGSITRTGNTDQTGDINLTGHSTISSTAKFADIQIDANTVSTMTGNNDLQLLAAGSGNVYFPDNNVKIDQNLTVNDTTHAGSITVHGITTAGTFSDGDIHIYDNIITTTVGSHDLELGAAGTGVVQVDFDNTQFDQNLTVDGITNLNNTIVGTGGLSPVPKDITLIGDYFQTGDVLQTGNRSISSQLKVHSNAYFEDISIVNNILATTTTDADLVLEAAGSGIVDINDNVTFSQNLRVNDITYTNGITNSLIVTSDTFSNNDIKISTNVITTTVGNNNLRLLAAGSGIISVPNDSVQFDHDLTVNGTTSLKNTVVGTGGLTPAPKNISLTGDYLQTGDVLQTGNRSISALLKVHSDAYFDSMSFVNNTIATTDADTDLSLQAAGTGKVTFDDNVTFSLNAEINTVESNGITNSGTVTSDIFTDGKIEIYDNHIKNTLADSDLRLLAAGTGIISIPLDPVLIDNNLVVSDTSILKNTSLTSLTHTGNTLLTGSVTQTGALGISNNLTVTGTDAFFTNIHIVNNTIFTTATNSDLRLVAAGSGIIDINDNATFSQQLRVNGTTTTHGVTNSGTITSDIFTDGDIEINDNYITTTVGNNNLILSGISTGGPKLEQIKFNANTISTETTNQGFTLTIPSGSLNINAATALKIPAGTTANRPTLSQGEFRFNSTDNLFRGYSTSTVSFAGVYSTDRRTSVLAHPTNNTILFTTNTLNNMTISSTGLTVNSLTVDNNLTFANNVISTASTNNDLFLTPNGSGKVVLDDTSISSNNITNTNATQPLILQNTGAGYVAFNGTNGVVLPVGPTVTDTSNAQIGDMRFNTDLSITEIFNGIDYVGFADTNSALLNAAEVQEITNLWALVIG